jgi:hypothetical protein
MTCLPWPFPVIPARSIGARGRYGTTLRGAASVLSCPLAVPPGVLPTWPQQHTHTCPNHAQHRPEPNAPLAEVSTVRWLWRDYLAAHPSTLGFVSGKRWPFAGRTSRPSDLGEGAIARQGRLSVVFNLQRARGKLVLVEPKTEDSRRTIRLPSAVVQALLDHRHRQREEWIRLRPVWQESELTYSD